MELLIGLICVGLVVYALLAVDTLKQKVQRLEDRLRVSVQRLEDRLNEKGDQFTETKPVSEPLGQAEQQTAAEPEAKHSTLARDLKESRLAGKKKETPAPKQPLAPPPIIQSPKEVTSLLARIKGNRAANCGQVVSTCASIQLGKTAFKLSARSIVNDLLAGLHVGEVDCTLREGGGSDHRACQ